ncbi:MAG: hypothetical protein A3F69_02575 [Acidobacteria bacterium RIFCSPLOWO2_12_FULL_66_10]|nr:MAG: hypothetical protein A3F69_02575 [Acidobacteria bacterium RIFCSPLOWO2_12_FULL_66_10]
MVSRMLWSRPSVNRDFAEMLSALSEAGAEFLVVGAHALAAHGIARATGDLDIWVEPTRENAERVMRALMAFGAPLMDLTLDDLRASGRPKDLLDLELLGD